ncbi:FecR family protein [Flavivirga sp. 57AJ16]|uniref:FecR family protein n=1 Tax=Flavivirga sp. 57AJ16 TaxID=3025307 RepID=UPI002365CC82|nr:FecR family protein [Flavivirga sp. 57AJ16]MDD7885100.1 DUF4974 domain-containing protein [Flavivirga sp. 57AJ16]
MKNIILKYLTDELTDLEIEQLLIWLEKPKNLKEFQTLVKENYNINMVYDNINEEMALQKVRKLIQKRSTSIRKLYIKYAAAAIFVIALTSTYFLRNTLFNNNIENTTPTIVNNQIEPGTDKATLTLETGETIILEKGTTYQTQNVTSNGETIKYSQLETRNLKPETNTLTIPRGGQFQITLADGTQVWLNSETQIKYPVAFVDGEPRNVELIYGEAYFDVSPSTDHDGSHFKVMNSGQEVEVLGTEFNIKAYKDETNIYTTLVEGKVQVSTNVTLNRDEALKNSPEDYFSEGAGRRDGEGQILRPGQQSTLNPATNSLTIATVNTTTETSWRHGIFGFRGKPLDEIMKVISRWYDVDVVFENKDLKTITFKGVLGKDQSIIEILNAIKSSSIINNYEIHGKTVILK